MCPQVNPIPRLNTPYSMRVDFAIKAFNPISAGGEGGDFTPQAFRRTFPYEAMVRGGCNYTLNSSFVITKHLKLVLVQKNFPMAHGRTSNFGG